MTEMADDAKGVIVCSFWAGSVYEAHADRLGESLESLSIPHDIEALEDLGSWRDNTARKASFLRSKLEEHAGASWVVWIDADAIVHAQLALLASVDADVAVYRFRPMSLFDGPRWHNFGRLLSGTVVLRPGDFARSVLDEWAAEGKAHPERLDQKNLATVLARREPSRIACLPPEYCWIERLMRPMDRGARPVVEHLALAMDGRNSADVPVSAPVPESESLAGTARDAATIRYAPLGKPLEVVWSGHMYDHSGYGKANREILLRVANSVRVRLDRSDLARERVSVDEVTRARVAAHLHERVSDSAPLLRFYTPQEERRRHAPRICYTMMETETVHPDFAKLLRENYDQMWTPTRWNAGTFRSAGVGVPMHVVPLGVDPEVFRPGPAPARPEARLLTTGRAGASERPAGFAFLSLFQPTFRKGADVLVAALLRAFAERPDAGCLVLATGTYGDLLERGCSPWALSGGAPARMPVRVYQLAGQWSEEDLAAIYRSHDAYVSASRGEGFDLPLLEMAACGKPVIASRCSAHADLLEDRTAFLFDPDGWRPVPDSGSVCRWYDGQGFAWFGDPSVSVLAEHMRAVADGKGADRAIALSDLVRTRYTWDAAARAVVARLREVADVR